MGALVNTEFRLTADVANAGTFTVPYPAGSTQASLTGTTGGQMATAAGDVYNQAASGAGTVAFAFGASNITVTNNTGVTLVSGTRLFFGLGRNDINGSYNLSFPKQIQDKVNALP